MTVPSETGWCFGGLGTGATVWLALVATTANLINELWSATLIPSLQLTMLCALWHFLRSQGLLYRLAGRVTLGSQLRGARERCYQRRHRHEMAPLLLSIILGYPFIERCLKIS